MSSASTFAPAKAWPAANRAEARRRRNHLLGVLLIATGLALALSPAAQAFTLPVTGPPSSPRMVFNNKMTVTSVCLPVTNPAGGTSVLYGQRFPDGPTNSLTPAIVLVHGIASSTEDWDFSPTWSVARALASAGYVVFSYDRLGPLSARSEPPRPAAPSPPTPTTPTTSNSSRRPRTAWTSTRTPPASSPTSQISPARRPSSTRRTARSPTSGRCTPRTTPTSR
jgi:hypothetical protein